MKAHLLATWEDVVGIMIQAWDNFDALASLSLIQKLTSHQYSWCLGYALASLFAFEVRIYVAMHPELIQ